MDHRSRHRKQRRFHYDVTPPRHSTHHYGCLQPNGQRRLRTPCRHSQTHAQQNDWKPRNLLATSPSARPRRLHAQDPPRYRVLTHADAHRFLCRATTSSRRPSQRHHAPGRLAHSISTVSSTSLLAQPFSLSDTPSHGDRRRHPFGHRLDELPRFCERDYPRRRP